MKLIDASDKFVKYAKKTGIGQNHPEINSLKNTLKSTPESVRKREYHRYPNCLSYHGKHCRHYNTNEMSPNIWIGEGPFTSKRYTNIDRFFKSILFHKKINFGTLVAIGPAYDEFSSKQDFFEYFNSSKKMSITHLGYRLTSSLPKLQNRHFLSFELQAEHKQKSKTLELLHLPKMYDMDTLETSDMLLQQLLQLVEKSKTSAIFIHCSAGLGRSGTIAFAMVLFKRYTELTAIASKQELAMELHKIWNQLNQIRPGIIRTEAQLVNALELADKMYDLHCRLENGEQLHVELNLSSEESTGDFTEDFFEKKSDASSLSQEGIFATKPRASSFEAEFNEPKSNQMMQQRK